ncbi:MAG TPA: hypothetical protein VL282_15115 [Tepidisphaeraceae bacterium]|nr:hypothetical protein [Tepidisphaeraceae bacterium]
MLTEVRNPEARQGASWHADWDRAREHFAKWWRREGLVLSITAPARHPHAQLLAPPVPQDQRIRWTDPAYRFARAEHQLSQTFFGGDAVPFFDTHIGPGSLGMFLGSEPQFTPRTVWYEPCMDDLQGHPKLQFNPQNQWYRAQRALIEEGVRRAAGRFLVGMPDLIENIDTLAQLRGSEQLLFDMIEQPAAVEQRLWEINDAFFASFDALYKLIKDERDGNAFSAFWLWGPGKTAKLQCDASAMFSPQMFRQFVAPPLAEQCKWLDYALYHLDGTQALCHLDALLEIDPLEAIQWTPQAGQPQCGNPQWYELYQRIKRAGKGLQVFSVELDEVVPLIETVGPEGLFIITTAAKTQDDAERLLQRIEQFY